MMVLMLVLITFCSWLPWASLPHTRTIAVHGEEVSRMTATISCSLPFRKARASSIPTIGAMIQLENSARRIGRAAPQPFDLGHLQVHQGRVHHQEQADADRNGDPAHLP